MADFDVAHLAVPQSGLDDPSHESDSNSLQSNLSAPRQPLLNPRSSLAADCFHRQLELFPAEAFPRHHSDIVVPLFFVSFPC